MFFIELDSPQHTYSNNIPVYTGWQSTRIINKCKWEENFSSALLHFLILLAGILHLTRVYSSRTQ